MDMQLHSAGNASTDKLRAVTHQAFTVPVKIAHRAPHWLMFEVNKLGRQKVLQRLGVTADQFMTPVSMRYTLLSCRFLYGFLCMAKFGHRSKPTLHPRKSTSGRSKSAVYA